MIVSSCLLSCLLRDSGDGCTAPDGAPAGAGTAGKWAARCRPARPPCAPPAIGASGRARGLRFETIFGRFTGYQFPFLLSNWTNNAPETLFVMTNSQKRIFLLTDLFVIKMSICSSCQIQFDILCRTTKFYKKDKEITNFGCPLFCSFAQKRRDPFAVFAIPLRAKKRRPLPQGGEGGAALLGWVTPRCRRSARGGSPSRGRGSCCRPRG